LFADFGYFPTLGIRPSEIEAVGRLPDFDKDSLLPIIRLRKWRNSGSLDKSFAALSGALSLRPAVLDLDVPPAEVKNATDARLVELHDPANGHASWVELFQQHPHLIPTLQWGGTNQGTALQALNLLALGRGLAIKLRRSQGWDIANLAALSGVAFGTAPILAILEYGHLARQADLSAAAAEINGISQAALAFLPSSGVTFTLAATSFPPEFASINRAHARLPIRERGLYSVAAPAFAARGVPLVYGDFASVCGNRGTMARGGAPRVDLACRNEWAYYRREEDQSYIAAAGAVIADPAWQDDLFIWGTNEIRRAATGDISNLHYPQRWVAVRINVHLHQQIHYNSPGALLATDEPWVDG
jgi:hypothetical protein